MAAGQTNQYAMSGHGGIYAGGERSLMDHHIWHHDLGLVALAAVICLAGSWVTLQLFRRSAGVAGFQRAGWLILTSVAAGAAIWCTHFIAMLGFDPGVPFSFDPILTIVSLIVAITGAVAGFSLATIRQLTIAPWVGGAFVGLAITAMHYTGMMGYAVQGIVTWNMLLLFLSIGFSVVLSAVAVRLARHARTLGRQLTAVGVFVAAIVLLHFTGMAAFQFEPLGVTLIEPMQGAIQALAMAIACVGFLIIGAGVASYLIDASVRTDSYEQLRQMAVTDSLTGLPNRVSFNSRLDHEIDHAKAQDIQVALVCIDLDRFKEINDLRGHGAGDEVLRTLAERMNYLLRDGEFVARLGGDEFAAVKRMQTPSELADFLARLEAVLFEPIPLDEFRVTPGASLGVAIYPQDAADKLALIGNADLAMYRAKATPATAVAFYDPSMDELVRERKNLANELRLAFDRDELDIYFQVQKSVATGEVRGYEALVRWHHPERGNVSPAEFIPIAEEYGLILQLGEWVLREACARAAKWEPAYKVAVNVSPMQFAHADLPRMVLETLVETGLAANRLELELTESTIFSDKERSLHMLRQIKGMGVTIALDDFGTGYSSLDTLRTFPFDKIKLDKSFVDQVESSEQTAAMVRAVLALGRSLKIPVLAEDIENAEQLSMLSIEGCDEVQGFLLGRPLPIDRIVSTGQLTLLPEAERAPVEQRRRAAGLAGDEYEPARKATAS
ncbi:signaling protein N terminal repeat/GGDEF/EAL domain-containing protein [Hyphomonas polymorpha PS728]|uniref:Signaling protein N terminal repeat/GGDEF/EAL domain-containing protein n=1 Tax=Hyphomonas polymorpha PS728 TaxID=1280954 RepID=A0A062VI56_9PROT|nr:bifunctional diguanylate cyclase/phosphodiesterase [Hyphomonas polymorpha]KDA00163.1 signaling protein N terminal repeat/GGDEF/EAL domain-containing protein [Hyphomonas polymorpha PS728]